MFRRTTLLICYSIYLVLLQTLGNHEFDNGIRGVIPFIEALNAPTVVANIIDTYEPEIQGTYKKSTIIERDGKKIGIIGVIAKNTNVSLL